MMTAMALQRGHASRILTGCGAILLAPAGGHTVTSRVSTFLRCTTGHLDMKSSSRRQMHALSDRILPSRRMRRCPTGCSPADSRHAPGSSRSASPRSTSAQSPCVRSPSSIRRMSVRVRPRFSVFSIRKCWSANAAICGRCVIHTTCCPLESVFSFLPTASAARPPMPISISSKTSVRGSNAPSSSVRRPLPQPPPPSPSAPASPATSHRPKQSPPAASAAHRHSSQSGTRSGPTHAPSNSPYSCSGVTSTLNFTLHRQIVDLRRRQLLQPSAASLRARRQRLRRSPVEPPHPAPPAPSTPPADASRFSTSAKRRAASAPKRNHLGQRLARTSASAGPAPPADPRSPPAAPAKHATFSAKSRTSASTSSTAAFAAASCCAGSSNRVIIPRQLLQMLQRRTQRSLRRPLRLVQQIMRAHRRRIQLLRIRQHPLLRLQLRIFVLGRQPGLLDLLALKAPQIQPSAAGPARRTATPPAAPA